MRDTYVTAVLELLNEGAKPDMIFSHLKEVMEKRGHSSLLLSVLATLLSSFEQSEKNNTPTVIVASLKDAETNEVKTALKNLGAGAGTPTVIVDDTIIGGAQVMFNHKMIDHSYKTQLHTLYKAAVNS